MKKPGGAPLLVVGLGACLVILLFGLTQVISMSAHTLDQYLIATIVLTVFVFVLNIVMLRYIAGRTRLWVVFAELLCLAIIAYEAIVYAARAIAF